MARNGIYAETLVFDGSRTFVARASGGAGGLPRLSQTFAFLPGKSGYKIALIGTDKDWSLQVPIRVTAMAGAGKTLFVAGRPDVVDPKNYWGTFNDPGKGMLMAFSSEDGTQLNKWELKSAPINDGIAAAGGSLFITLKNGSILCFEKSK